MNKVFLIGNLTRDPEFKKTPNDISVCTFSLAVNRRFASSNGEREADFLNIVAWRGLADICAKYLQKGRPCAVAGEIRTRSYTTQQGEKRYITEIQADDVQFLGTGSSGSGGGRIDGDRGPTPPPFPSEDFTPLDDEELPF